MNAKLPAMKAVRVLAASLAALTLVGCADVSPRSAATVNGVEIAQADVDRTYQGLGVLLVDGVPARVTGPGVTNFAIRGEIARTLAHEHGIELTDAERARVVAQDPALTALAEMPAGAAVVPNLADTAIVITRLGQERWNAGCAAQEVRVNPRNGVWLPAQCTLLPGAR